MDTSAAPFVDIVLTLEEVQLLIALLCAPGLPGFEPNLAEADPDSAARGMLYAERSLRARELARLRPDGSLGVNTVLLSMIETCVRPERALLIQHLDETRQLRPLYGHKMGMAVVVYTIVEPGIYRFSLLPSPEALIETALAFAQLDALADDGAALSLQVMGTALSSARAAAEIGNLAEARDLLAAGNEHEAGSRLAETLAGPHRVTVINVLTTSLDSPPKRQELTLLAGATRSFLMLHPGAPDQPYILQSTRAGAVRDLLLRELA